MKYLLSLFFLLVLSCNLFSQPQYAPTFGTTSTNSFPWQIAAGKQIQALYLAGDFNVPSPAPSGNINKLSFMLATAFGPYTYTNVQIRLAQTNLTVFAPSVWFTDTSFRTVYTRSSVSLTGTVPWFDITLDSLFAYDNTRGLVIEVTQCNAQGATGFSSSTFIAPSIRRNTSLTTSSCPFVWGQQSTTLNIIGISLAPPVGIGTNNEIPVTYKLEQNYPNPFNPVTNIGYSLPKGGYVTLKVYDELGREVAVLINNFIQAGNHSINFDASNLASGLYFYKLEAGDFRDTKKLMVIK